MPDHWYAAAAAVMTMKAGKHVYLEKPTSHNPAENELLIRAALKYDRVVQVGNQRRSWPNVTRPLRRSAPARSAGCATPNRGM